MTNIEQPQPHRPATPDSDRLWQLLRDHRDEIEEIAARCGASNIRVFGSVGRGVAGVESDVDLVVEFAPEVSLVEHAALIDHLEELLGLHVDVVSDTGVRQSPNPFAQRILDEAVPL